MKTMEGKLERERERAREIWINRYRDGSMDGKEERERESE